MQSYPWLRKVHLMKITNFTTLLLCSNQSFIIHKTGIVCVLELCERPCAALSTKNFINISKKVPSKHLLQCISQWRANDNKLMRIMTAEDPTGHAISPYIADAVALQNFQI